MSEKELYGEVTTSEDEIEFEIKRLPSAGGKATMHLFGKGMMGAVRQQGPPDLMAGAS